jgi:glyoxylase-like metal-dependent hydrolase (beta-lactamase superfamily II)
MIHYLYLGHFDHDGGFIRFSKRGNTKPVWHRPVVVRPLDPSVIAELLDERGLT